MMNGGKSSEAVETAMILQASLVRVAAWPLYTTRSHGHSLQGSGAFPELCYSKNPKTK